MFTEGRHVWFILQHDQKHMPHGCRTRWSQWRASDRNHGAGTQPQHRRQQQPAPQSVQGGVAGFVHTSDYFRHGFLDGVPGNGCPDYCKQSASRHHSAMGISISFETHGPAYEIGRKRLALRVTPNGFDARWCFRTAFACLDRLDAVCLREECCSCDSSYS
jgi:hypothetical protein